MGGAQSQEEVRLRSLACWWLRDCLRVPPAQGHIPYSPSSELPSLFPSQGEQLCEISHLWFPRRLGGVPGLGGVVSLRPGDSSRLVLQPARRDVEQVGKGAPPLLRAETLHLGKIGRPDPSAASQCRQGMKCFQRSASQTLTVYLGKPSGFLFFSSPLYSAVSCLGE